MKFSKTFEIRFVESDHEAKITPIALFNLLQETAVQHSVSLGLGGEGLAARGLAWMLNKAHIEFLHYPKTHEEVTVTTWGYNLRGLFAIREWTVLDASGTCCLRATSRWIVFDIHKKRIVRLPDFLAETYGEVDERAVEDSFPREKAIDSGEIERSFHVRVSDLDTNNHANSGSYVDWCLEAVPNELLSTLRPKSLEITYKKECALGTGLQVISLEGPNTEPNLRTFQHTIRDEENGAILTIATSTWPAN